MLNFRTRRLFSAYGQPWPALNGQRRYDRYRDMVLWVISFSTSHSIRGNASFHYKMAERLNTVKIHQTKNILIKTKLFYWRSRQYPIRCRSINVVLLIWDVLSFSFVGWVRMDGRRHGQNVLHLKEWLYKAYQKKWSITHSKLYPKNKRGTPSKIAPKLHQHKIPSADIENPDMNL
jgi:hypothetical protein